MNWTKWGGFDCVLDNDSRFFINLMRLKVSDVPEFKNSYQRINDYLSEIATLLNAFDIYPDIAAYTKRIQQELKLNKENYPDCIFREDGLIVIPYKSCEILFLPTDILHELPIAQCWDDIDRVVMEIIKLPSAIEKESICVRLILRKTKMLILG